MKTMTTVLVFLPATAFAQGGGPIVADWRMAVAFLINAVLVRFLVQWLKEYLPTLPPQWKQVLALVGGTAILAAGTALSNFLGYPVDLSPIATLFAGLTSGLAAIGVHNVQKQRAAGKAA